MIPFASFIIVFSALIGVGAACAAVGQACFRRRSDDVSTRLAVLWSVASIGLSIVVPALDGFQASKTAAIASAALLAATALASFFLSRYWREAAMKREAERLQLAKSGYAESQLADPEVPQEPDIEALCAKAARTYDLTRREEDVLRLLVEGRTAPQIAEELVVSPNTVKTHVRNLYRKLGINRRADLACRLES